MSGIPAVGSQGLYTVLAKVTDSSNATATRSLSLTINQGLSITAPTSLTSGAEGVAYGPVTFTATGGQGSYAWTATGLPSNWHWE